MMSPFLPSPDSNSITLYLCLWYARKAAVDGIGCGMAMARRRGRRSAWFEGMEWIDARARTSTGLEKMVCKM